MLFKAQFLLALGAASAAAQSLTSVLAATPELSTLTTLLGNFPDLVEALSCGENLTILAPSNSAFQALSLTPAGQAVANDTDLLKAVLQYHVVNGLYPAASIPATGAFVPTLLTNSSYTNVTGGQVVEGISTNVSVTFVSGFKAVSGVTTADVAFDGGIIHIINSVLTLPPTIPALATSAGLTSLADALVATNLLDTVTNAADVTVFAPTNAAFAAIADTVAGLTTEQLTSVLLYHVIQGTVAYSTLLTDGEMVATLDNDATVTISLANGTVMVNQANVVNADVLVANGVVHVIDAVLIPPELAPGQYGPPGHYGN